MMKYLISFPARAMEVPAEDFAAVGEAAHEVIREAKGAGLYVFGGGINEDVAPLMVASAARLQTKPIPRRRSSTAVSVSCSSRHAKPPSCGLQRSRKLAAARRNSASLVMTPRADEPAGPAAGALRAAHAWTFIGTGMPGPIR
jgi:hypothetical protein